MKGETELEKAVPIIHVTVPDAHLGRVLLDGKFIAYHDHRYGVTSNEHHIVMKLLSQDDVFVLFYLHVPYAYPIPDGIKDTVTSALETTMKRAIQKMEFINAGTESEKKHIQFRVELGGHK